MRQFVIRIPIGESVDTVGPQAADAIRQHGGQWVSPMPGTIEAGGHYIAHALTRTDVPPELIEQMAPGWQVIAASDKEGTEVRPLDMDALRPHLAPVPVVSGMEITGYTQAPDRIPHSFAGWA